MILSYSNFQIHERLNEFKKTEVLFDIRFDNNVLLSEDVTNNNKSICIFIFFFKCIKIRNSFTLF